MSGIRIDVDHACDPDHQPGVKLGCSLLGDTVSVIVDGKETFVDPDDLMRAVTAIHAIYRRPHYEQS